MAAEDAPLRVGDLLRGYCGGSFGRDSYHDKRVEAIGADWVVARTQDYDPGDGIPEMYWGRPESLCEYRTKPPEE